MDSTYLCASSAVVVSVLTWGATLLALQCAEEGCTTQFHAICGRRSAFVMFMNEEHKLVAYCGAHRAPRDVPLGLVEPDA